MINVGGKIGKKIFGHKVLKQNLGQICETIRVESKTSK